MVEPVRVRTVVDASLQDSASAAASSINLDKSHIGAGMREVDT